MGPEKHEKSNQLFLRHPHLVKKPVSITESRSAIRRLGRSQPNKTTYSSFHVFTLYPYTVHFEFSFSVHQKSTINLILHFY
ncbi:hypothetical protein AHF37_10131 [Paragonimus kellicotti]|nr:hypothetical protein AHF37_10131 [Paragonimus kellicotti]